MGRVLFPFLSSNCCLHVYFFLLNSLVSRKENFHMFKAYILLSLGLLPLQKNPTFLWIAYESLLWALMHPSEGEFVMDASLM